MSGRTKFVRLLRGGLAILGGCFVAGAGIELVNWGAYRILRHRLTSLYAITQRVSKGMAREQVMRVIQEHEAPYLKKHVFPDGNVTLWVHYALVDTCSTAIGFKNGSLDSTWTIGEDSPTDYCPQAPPDIR